MLLGVMPNMHLLGINWFHAMPSNPAVEVLAQVGVLILLFEVGLIFAGIGLTLSVGGERIIDESVFSAVVIMVIVTTMMTPPALKWSLSRGGRRARSDME